MLKVLGIAVVLGLCGCGADEVDPGPDGGDSSDPNAQIVTPSTELICEGEWVECRDRECPPSRYECVTAGSSKFCFVCN